MDEALPLAGTVTGLGKLMVTPVGEDPLQEAERLTVEVNPPTEVRIIVADCIAAGDRVTAAGAG